MSLYPSTIPSNSNYPDRTDDVDWLYAARYNEIKNELLAICQELGILPKGSYASVRARLDAIEAKPTSKIEDTDQDTLLDTEETADKDEIVGKVAGVEALRIHSSGIADLAKQSRCRVYLSGSNQTISSSSNTKVQLNAENHDEQNEFDPTTNHRFTASKEGYYLICAAIHLLSPSDGQRIIARIYKNGSPQGSITICVGGTINSSSGVADILQLNAGDYIELYAHQDSGADKNVATGKEWTFMSIHKLS